MKTGYFSTALVITVLLLIIIFQNVQNNGAFMLFFSFSNVMMAIPLVIVSLLGITAGVLYTLTVHSAIDKKESKMREELDDQF